MSESTKDNRRDFLRKGVWGVTLAASGQLMFSCSSENKDTEKIKVLTPEGELVEVEKQHLSHVHKTVPVSYEEERRGIPRRKFVMVIDLAKCKNARKCIIACQEHHHRPKDQEWLNLKLMKDSENLAAYWFPKACFHCDNPPCVKVCPVDATYKRQDGIVLVDNDRCIGCKFCMAACPYSARTFNWAEPDQPEEVKSLPYSAETSVPAKMGTVEKCDFCPDMIREGKLPPCVSACPNGAFYFGDQNEDIVTNGSETVRFSKLIYDKGGYRYMEELGTEPRVYYLPPTDRIFPVERGLDDLEDEVKERYKDVTL